MQSGVLVNTNICQEWDVDFEEVEVENVLLHLPMVKALVGMMLQMKFLKTMIACLKSLFMQMIHQCQDFGLMPNQIDTKGTISGVIASMEAYFIDGIVVQSVCKDII